MENDDDERVIPFSKPKLLATVLLFYVLEGVGAWTLLDARSPDGIDGTALFWGLTLFLIGAIAGLAFTRKLADKRPGLVLGPDGLWNNATLGRARFIPWTEIESVYIFQDKNRRSLFIQCKPAHWALRTGKRFPDVPYGKATTMSPLTLKIGMDELYEECRRYHDRYGRRSRRAPEHVRAPGRKRTP